MTDPAMTDPAINRVEILAPEGIPEIEKGHDLAATLAAAVDLEPGDVVVVTSKVVAKAEGRVRRGGRDAAIERETARVVARRGPLRIVRTRLGLTLAAAGIDASNVEPGRHVLLPRDPDASARALRARLLELTGAVLGVVVTDTAGRAWREGQTDIAIGAAGLIVLDDHAGRGDRYGNPLAVTMPAVADEIASAAELAQGKLSGRPFAVVRGRADLVLPAGAHGPGAQAILRAEGADLFGFGAREAVVRALAGELADRSVFGEPADVTDLLRALGTALGVAADPVTPERITLQVDDSSLSGLEALCFAHGWEVVRSPADPGHPIRCLLRPGEGSAQILP